MSEENRGFTNALGCWALAAGGGAVATLMMLLLGGTGFIGSVFLGGLAFLAIGLFLQVVVLKPLPPMGSVRPGEDRSLHAVPPSDPAAVSVEYAAAKRKAEAEGKTPPPPPGAWAKSGPAPASPAPAKAPSAAASSAAPAKAASAAPSKAAASDATEGSKPTMLDAARGGQPDDLKKIKGVGPKLETLLHGMGIYHFDQIANWTDEEVAWVDANLEGFKGRVTRDDWIDQARALAAGDG